MKNLLLLALLGVSVNGYAEGVVGERQPLNKNKIKHKINKDKEVPGIGVCTEVRSFIIDYLIVLCGEEKENEDLIVAATMIMNDFHTLYLKFWKVTSKGHSGYKVDFVHRYMQERGWKGLDQDWILLEERTESCIILMSMVSDIYMTLCGGYLKRSSILVLTAFSMMDRFHRNLREIYEKQNS